MKNTAARVGNGVFMLHPGKQGTDTTTVIREQFLTRRGIPESRAGLVASLAFTEAAA